MSEIAPELVLIDIEKLTPVERIESFCIQHRRQRASDNVIHGLHLGTEREAELRCSDLEQVMAASKELYETLAWFIDDIDGTHTVMVDFDANVDRARAALVAALVAARGQS